MLRLTALVAALACQAATSYAHDDYLTLIEPKVLASPCAQQWESETRRVNISKPSEFHVDLTVGMGRFESQYVSFNTRTYNGQFPAPTIKVCPGDKLTVRVTNELEAGASNVTNLHLHGMHVSPKGMQDNILTNIQPGADRTYEYFIRPDHPSGSFWYHPHSHGLVNSQLGGLMAGSLIVVDRPDDVPKEIDEMDDIVLIIQGVCVENCHEVEDNIVNLLTNKYDGDDMMMMDMSMDMSMDMDMGDSADESEDSEETKFPVSLSVSKSVPLTNTSLVHAYVNGQYLPEIKMQPGELKRFRYVNTIPNNVAELVIPDCEMYVIARDGVYVSKPQKKSVVILPPGSRADVIVRCASEGTYHVETQTDESRNELLGKAHRHRVPTQQIIKLTVSGEASKMVLPTVLPAPPAYMKDATKLSEAVTTENTYNYEFSVWMEEGSGVTYGVNKKKFDHKFINHSMTVNQVQEWELSVKNYGHECQEMDGSAMAHMHMSKGGHCHPMTHPFHMHGSHFQITKADAELDPDELLFGVGEWRDTIPLFKSNVQIRFTPRDHMVGHILTHCHFASHSDNGMAQMVEVRSA
ncbi:hypothetical protein Poli38472_009419 [Pythium oligandrum]|uniref:Multicopper oxidase n=1 Tax=Pythium oligandrum TaxID=41045 RepID=A0A8K1FMV9_PYTOL|nr:hypothetical protein Poli38472_009419 [Pythium oligandrum]|eukprot:TMW65252.1 hypothetical protein Poli38472_009419 [Pythium oligandrum]